MTENIPTDYYVQHKDEIMSQMRWMLRLMRRPIAKRYGRDGVKSFIADTLAELEALLPEIPYIGGFGSSYTTNLIQSAGSLAMYRAAQARGSTVDDVGLIIHEGLASWMTRVPKFLRHWIGRRQYRTKVLEGSRNLAAETQKRQYPGDWVVEFVEGDDTFDWGLTMTECGIQKFLEAQDAVELGPYMCAVDYVGIGAFGVELRRTKTLIHGCDCCDFRYVVDGTPPPLFPPRFPEKDCGGELQA